MHTYKQQSRKTPKNSRCDEKGSKEPGTSVHHSKQNMLLESRPSTRNQSSTSTSCCSIGSFVRVAAGGEENAVYFTGLELAHARGAATGGSS
jgi:hypothetical protein